jgi:hypothetical protein
MMGKAGAPPGKQRLTSDNPSLYIKVSSLLSVEKHRYTCRTCRNNCELIVRGKITRIRQVCPQFQAMDGYSLWTEQDG